MKPPGLPNGMPPGAGLLDVALPQPQGGGGFREAMGAGEFARMCDALLARIRPAAGGMPAMGGAPGMGAMRPPMPMPMRPPFGGAMGQGAAVAPAAAPHPPAPAAAAPAAAPLANTPGMGGGISPHPDVDLRGVLPPLVVDMPPLHRAMGERQLYFLMPGADASLLASPPAKKKPG